MASMKLRLELDLETYLKLKHDIATELKVAQLNYADLKQNAIQASSHNPEFWKERIEYWEKEVARVQALYDLYIKTISRAEYV